MFVAMLGVEVDVLVGGSGFVGLALVAVSGGFVSG